jgi:hypothetical protein
MISRGSILLSGGCEGKTLLAEGIKAYRSRIPLNREGLNPGNFY